MRTPKELCETLAEGALANYGRHGHLVPVIILLDREQHDVAKVVPQVEAETGGMPGAVLAIGMTMVPLFDAHYLALISEAWIAHQSLEDERIPARGELGQRAEAGDQTVGTCLLVTCWDLVHLEQSYGLTYHVEGSFERTDMEGAGDGELGDAVRQMVELTANARASRPPGKVPMRLVQAATDVLEPYMAVLMTDPDAVVE